VAALRRAVAGAEVHAVAVLIGEILHLDVARLGEVALHVALVAAEVGQRLALGRLEVPQRPHRHRLHDLHATTAAAVGGLDGDRIAELLTEGGDDLSQGR
jgi:hypothetical protein